MTSPSRSTKHGAPAETRRVAARPTGAAAPTQPPKKVDPVVEAAMELVEPAPGYALARLVMAEERASELGLPSGTEALLDAAMLRLLAVHPGDDLLSREYGVGEVVFASLEGLAPLLATRVFLLPIERIQGSLPVPGVGAGTGTIGFVP